MIKRSTFDRAYKPFWQAPPPDKVRTNRTLRRKMIRLWYVTEWHERLPNRKRTLEKIRRLPMRQVLSTNRNYC